MNEDSTNLSFCFKLYWELLWVYCSNIKFMTCYLAGLASHTIKIFDNIQIVFHCFLKCSSEYSFYPNIELICLIIKYLHYYTKVCVSMDHRQMKKSQGSDFLDWYWCDFWFPKVNVWGWLWGHKKVH